MCANLRSTKISGTFPGLLQLPRNGSLFTLLIGTLLGFIMLHPGAFSEKPPKLAERRGTGIIVCDAETNTASACKAPRC